MTKMIIKDKQSFEAGMLYMHHQLEKHFSEIEKTFLSVCDEIENKVQFDKVWGDVIWNDKHIEFEG